MNKLIKSMMLVAGVTVFGLANATSPAETAGLCAANALIIKKVADQAGIPKISKLAQDQLTRNYDAYGNDPGFKKAAEWQFKQNVSADGRLKIADGCTASGF